MRRVRNIVAVVIMSVALLGFSAPANAALVQVDNSRAGRFCFTVHTAGIFDPMRICIPLI